MGSPRLLPVAHRVNCVRLGLLALSVGLVPVLVHGLLLEGSWVEGGMWREGRKLDYPEGGKWEICRCGYAFVGVICHVIKDHSLGGVISGRRCKQEERKIIIEDNGMANG